MRIEAYREGVKVWEVKGGLSEAVEKAVERISEAPLPDELRVARRQLAEKLREALLEKELPLPPIFIGRFKHTPPPLSDKLLSDEAKRLLSEANSVRTRHGYMKLAFNDPETLKAWVLRMFSPTKPIIRRYELAEDAWIVTDSVSRMRTRDHYVVFKNLNPVTPNARWLAYLHVACDCPWSLRWRGCWQTELVCTHASVCLMESAPFLFKPLSRRQVLEAVVAGDKPFLRRMNPQLRVALLRALPIKVRVKR